MIVYYIDEFAIIPFVIYVCSLAGFNIKNI